MGRGIWCTITVAVGIVLAPSVGAHVDPPGCSESGVALIVSMYRSNGAQGLAGAASECEQTSYRVTLSKADASTCAVSGGRLTLTTPDGATHSLADPVPCIGAAGAADGPCATATTSFASVAVAYAVRPGDAVNGILTATAHYEGGVIHDGDRDTAGVAATTQRRAEIVICDDGDPTTTDVCDPRAPGAAACSHTVAPSPVEPVCFFSPLDPADVLACGPMVCRASPKED